LAGESACPTKTPAAGADSSSIMLDMSYYGSKELASAFRTVRQNTLQIAEEIPEDKYGFEPAPGARTVAQTLMHIAMIPRLSRQLTSRDSLEGFDFAKYRAEGTAEESKSRTKAELLQWLRESGDDFAQWVETLLEEFLGHVFTFPAGAQPPSRTRFDLLLGVKEHEMHHRGQLMLMERMLGITPHLTRRNEERMAAMQRQAQGA
jgi:uncharacterized damage-inducible protein DinB